MKCDNCGKSFEWPAWSEFKHTIVYWSNEKTGHGSSTKKFASTCPHCNYPIYEGNTEINYPSASGYLPEYLSSNQIKIGDNENE